MPQRLHKVKSIDLDLVGAIRRASLRRGIFIPPVSADSTDQDTKPAAKAKTETSQPVSAGTAKEKTDQSDESYPERAAEGEPDSKIEAEEKQKQAKLDKLKSEAEGSKTAKGPEELEELTEKSLDVLYEATTVWPFTLFPDTLTLDREKLTIAKRHFWKVATITSVPVGEIMSAEVSVGPFFGSLDLTFRFFANNERKINFLTRHDATEIQRLIHGYIIAHRREIDVSSVKKHELIDLLCTLGQGATD